MGSTVLHTCTCIRIIMYCTCICTQYNTDLFLETTPGEGEGDESAEEEEVEEEDDSLVAGTGNGTGITDKDGFTAKGDLQTCVVIIVYSRAKDWVTVHHCINTLLHIICCCTCIINIPVNKRSKSTYPRVREPLCGGPVLRSTSKRFSSF